MADVAPSLAQLRAEIDRIDDELLGLLESRVAIGRRVAAAKGDASGPYLRPGREAAILKESRKAQEEFRARKKGGSRTKAGEGTAGGGEEG